MVVLAAPSDHGMEVASFILMLYMSIPPGPIIQQVRLKFRRSDAEDCPEALMNHLYTVLGGMSSFNTLRSEEICEGVVTTGFKVTS